MATTDMASHLLEHVGDFVRSWRIWEDSEGFGWIWWIWWIWEAWGGFGYRRARGRPLGGPWRALGGPLKGP